MFSWVLLSKYYRVLSRVLSKKFYFQTIVFICAAVLPLCVYIAVLFSRNIVHTVIRKKENELCRETEFVVDFVRLAEVNALVDDFGNKLYYVENEVAVYDLADGDRHSVLVYGYNAVVFNPVEHRQDVFVDFVAALVQLDLNQIYLAVVVEGVSHNHIAVLIVVSAAMVSCSVWSQPLQARSLRPSLSQVASRTTAHSPYS